MSQSYDMDIGICCFCGDECNPCSQSCGSCSRIISGFTLGWNSLPISIYEKSITNENFRDDKYNGKVYYTGIGSSPQIEYLSENEFRQIIWLNQNNFDEKCPHDPRTCSLRRLVKWAKAKLIPN